MQPGRKDLPQESSRKRLRGGVVIRKLSASLLALVAIVSAVNIVCLAQSETLLTRHLRAAVVNGEAKLVGRLPATETMHFDVVLALRHQPELENFLQELYDPWNPSYRHFVTVPEFTARFGPSQEDYDAVIAFAKTSGLTVVGGSRDAFDVQLQGAVANVEKAFHVTLGVYRHPTENRIFYAVDREPTVDLPFELWHITGLDNYSTPHPQFVRRNFKVKTSAVTGSCPEQSFCGSDMRAAYYENSTLTGVDQNIGLLEFAGFDIADVNTYYQNAGQTRTAAVTGISTDGSSVNCTQPNCDDTEQTIDITQALGMAPGVSTVYVYVSHDSDTAVLGAMSTDTPLPLQLSSSWTWVPADPSTDDPYFEKMAAQGQSFFQASGDRGAYKGSAPWPSNSAYVIAVGGTVLVTQSAGGPWASETAWGDGGGGWGTNIPIPPWQQLPDVITKANEGSTTYRNDVDVSANANFSFYVCADQQPCTANEYGGTSFAAPMWAGYLALTNQQAASNGDSPVGFIDPIIYPLGLGSGYDSDFHDITSGSDGFPTTVGYDLPTGWGTPNGSSLINALAGSAGLNFTLSALPSSLSVPRGGSANSTITITPVNGFSGNVTLAASGLPKGVSASFSPNPATSTSVLTLTAASTAKLGTATVTITGTAGSLSASTTVTITVDALGSFTLTASPKTLAVAQGSSGTSTITIVPTGGFDQEVALSASGMPSGVAASFSTNPTTSTSMLTLTVSGSAATGKSTITITGTYGSLSKKTTIKLTVTAS
jgi:subtilase family serine protease